MKNGRSFINPVNGQSMSFFSDIKDESGAIDIYGPASDFNVWANSLQSGTNPNQIKLTTSPKTVQNQIDYFVAPKTKDELVGEIKDSLLKTPNRNTSKDSIFVGQDSSMDTIAEFRMALQSEMPFLVKNAQQNMGLNQQQAVELYSALLTDETSAALFEKAKGVMPGGVPMSWMAKWPGAYPVFVESAAGSHFTDVDGNKYIDYISSWGPMILGHAHPKVIKAISETAKNGTSFGMPTTLETDLAKLSLSMVPEMEKIRFVNSGTEACMSAIRLARGFTNKEKIIKFSGCYHGHSDSFLIEAGSGVVTFGTPNSPGVTKGTAQDTLIAPYNNLNYVKELFQKNKDEVAAIIIEPVAGNMGCVIPQNGFIEGLRKLCDQNNCLLIFDEVMTGFRLAKGGAQEVLGVNADIVTYGKVIGGGLPVGAFSSRDEIMNNLSPEGSVYQAGTLSGNPLAMSAGLATLSELKINDNGLVALALLVAQSNPKEKELMIKF